MSRLLITFTLAAIILATGSLKAAQSVGGFSHSMTTEQLAFFEKKIRPALAEHCYKCHSLESEKIKGGLRVDTREAIRKGGDSGHAVIPNNLDDSLLIEAIRYQNKDLQMPPKSQLPDYVVADFEEWVKMGAPDPREEPNATASTRRKGDMTHWAYQQPKKTAVPSVQNKSWPQTELDHYILSELEKKGLQPSKDASRQDLIRRVYFDLIGLPPTPLEVDAFVKDTADDQKALEKVVDKLLASPQFGERWGRYWLDVARYGESSGKEANITFPNAWRYRDYVIKSFNEDKPFTQFIREQIAGDLLPAKDETEKTEHIIATGFLALGPKSLNENEALQFKMDMIDEQIDVLSQAFLGSTIACARCHDHKFDPISNKEYYAMAGIFLSTETYFGTVTSQGNRRASSLIPLNLPNEPVNPGEVVSASQRKSMQAQLDKLIEQRQQLFTEAREARMNGGDPTRARLQLLRLVGQIGYLEQKLSSIDEFGIPRPYAMGVADREQKYNSRIYIRGDVDQPGDRIPRGLVKILGPAANEPIPQNASGRLQLADAIASPENPLTARVMANRIWYHLFGRGEVNTVDNFGFMGEKPTNPALLDYLALKFVDDGWSVKSLVKDIVLSRTYRESTEYSSFNYSADPDNKLQWRMTPRRLDAEAARDAMLAVSGQLNLKAPQGSEVAKVGDGFVGRNIQENRLTVEDNHRAVYLPIVRDLVPESLRLFDFAEPSLVVGERDVTTVPAQALYLLNDDFVQKQATKFAQKIMAVKGSGTDRIQYAYQQAFSRPATDEEIKLAGEFFKKFVAALSPAEQRKSDASTLAWSAYCQALLASADFRFLN